MDKTKQPVEEIRIPMSSKDYFKKHPGWWAFVTDPELEPGQWVRFVLGAEHVDARVRVVRPPAHEAVATPLSAIWPQFHDWWVVVYEAAQPDASSGHDEKSLDDLDEATAEKARQWMADKPPGTYRGITLDDSGRTFTLEKVPLQDPTRPTVPNRLVYVKESPIPPQALSLNGYQKQVTSGGHSMDPNRACPVCGDMDGCHEPARLRNEKGVTVEADRGGNFVLRADTWVSGVERALDPTPEAVDQLAAGTHKPGPMPNRVYPVDPPVKLGPGEYTAIISGLGTQGHPPTTVHFAQRLRTRPFTKQPSGRLVALPDDGSRELALRLDVSERPVDAALNWWVRLCGQNAVNKGFRDRGGPKRNVGEALMLQVSELAESFEAYRNGTWEKPCDKKTDPQLTNLEEEVADQFVRLCDFCDEFGVDLGKSVLAKVRYNLTRPAKHGGKKC